MQYYTRRRDGAVSELLYAVKFGKSVHRDKGDIPGMAPAQDVYSFAADPDRSSDRLYMTIKNPSKAYRNAYSQ